MLRVNPSEEILAEATRQRARLLFREDPGKLAQALGFSYINRHGGNWLATVFADAAGTPRSDP